jgi:hypothetical protein
LATKLSEFKYQSDAQNIRRILLQAVIDLLKLQESRIFRKKLVKRLYKSKLWNF